MDVYSFSLSNRMNEVMKVLTVVATIFIPPTFMVGVSGMNFQWMPELKWRWGYPAVWAVILVLAVIMSPGLPTKRLLGQRRKALKAPERPLRINSPRTCERRRCGSSDFSRWRARRHGRLH